MGKRYPRPLASRRKKTTDEFIQELESRRLLATINVTAFGANGNDNNDDRAAVVNAINASNSGDTIYFPAGTYRFSQPITSGSSGLTKPIGGGRIYKGDTTFVTRDNGTHTINPNQTILLSTAVGEEAQKRNAIFYIREGNPNPNNFNAKFANLTFSGRGIKMDRPSNAMVEGMIFDNNLFDVTHRGYNNGIEWTTGLRDSKITNNIFYVGGNNGVDGYNWDNVTIANNWFLNPPGTWGNEGIHMHAFLYSSSDLLIEQNYFSGLNRMGIEYQYGGVDTLVQDNWYENPYQLPSDDKFAYSIVADEGVDTITRRNTAIMPTRAQDPVTYVKIVFELGGHNLKAYDNYTWGGNHVVAVNGYNASGDVYNNFFDEFHQAPSNHGGNLAHANLHLPLSDPKHNDDRLFNEDGSSRPSFNPDGRIVGSTAPIRYRPLTNQRYGELPPDPPTDNKPATPTSLSATPVSFQQINLNWSDQATNEEGYRVEYKTDLTDWSTYVVLGANSVAASITNLTELKHYYFRVVAFNNVVGGGDSAPSNIADATTLDAGVPATPTNLTGIILGLNRVDLTWTDNATNETNYFVERLLEDGVTWLRMATLGQDVTTYSMTSLASGRTFSFRVIAYNADANGGAKQSAPSNIAVVQTPIADATTSPSSAPKRRSPAFFYTTGTTGGVSPPVTGSS